MYTRATKKNWKRSLVLIFVEKAKNRKSLWNYVWEYARVYRRKKKKFGIVSNATFVAENFRNLEKSRQERKDKTTARLSRDPVVVALSFAANRFPSPSAEQFRKSYRLNWRISYFQIPPEIRRIKFYQDSNAGNFQSPAFLRNLTFLKRSFQRVI